MQIEKNFSLKHYNTFGIDSKAAFFSSFTTVDELAEQYAYASSENKLPHLILGGGSNILFTRNYNGHVLKNDLKGIELVKDDSSHYYLKAAAGENWHQLVLHCLANNYAGMENLSLIPGNVGASPMQNIGAYGVELQDVFHELDAWHLHDQRLVTFKKEDCRFGYRDSIFKKTVKGEFVIVQVTFKLQKTPTFNIQYGVIKQELDAMGITDLSIQAISKAVINIRTSKLPDPAIIGNAGSFFKNPTIPVSQFNELQLKYPAIVGYATTNDQIKVAAGWLIEQCGWKGYRKGDAGCHDRQALVLVNYGHADGLDIYNLSEEIMHSVETTFGILLEREVNIL